MRQLVIEKILRDFNAGDNELGIAIIRYPVTLSKLFGRKVEWEGELTSQKVKQFLETCPNEDLLDILNSQAICKYC